MAEQKWYETTHRWCQTNLTEIDAEICDIGFWKWYRCLLPSRFPL